MATRPGNGGQATRKQGNELAVATLGFGVVGLILGVLSPPALLLGLVAVVLGAGNLGRGRERLNPAGLGMTVAAMIATQGDAAANPAPAATPGRSEQQTPGVTSSITRCG
jgi:hypothetical protein